MISMIIPRPIAWVGTSNENGGHNLAPFSFFNGFAATPPLIGIGFAPHDDKPGKDTLLNVQRTGELTVNLPTVKQLDAVVASAQDLPYGADEFEAAGVTPLPGEVVSAPRVAEAQISMECVTWELKPLGKGGSTLLLAEIKLLHIADTLLNEWGTVDSNRFDALARLGGISYAGLSERIDRAAGGG